MSAGYDMEQEFARVVAERDAFRERIASALSSYRADHERCKRSDCCHPDPDTLEVWLAVDRTPHPPTEEKKT